jgi:hypothetical protein
MPSENGETQHETSENEVERDSRDDSLERAIKHLQESLNESEELGDTKSDEESSGEDDLERATKDYQDALNESETAEREVEKGLIGLIDGFNGKVTEACEIEAKNPEDESTARITTCGEHLTNKENHETEDKPVTNVRGSSEARDKEEHGTESEKEGHLIKEESQLFQHGDAGSEQAEKRIGFKESRDNETTGESRLTFEQHQGNLEYDNSQKARAYGYRDNNLEKESEKLVTKDSNYQEGGDTSLKSTDNSRVFVETNLELLDKEGVTVKDNEAKLTDKTRLRLNEKGGVTIIDGDQHYKITMVEKEKIGDTELNRYRTKQGEEFLYIPKENKLAPPYETPWYALPTNTRIYLDSKYKNELLEAAIEKAGEKRAVRKELEKRGTMIGREYLIGHLHERINGIRSDKLIPILSYLQRDFDEPSRHIRAIGTREAVENPKLPFKLNSLDGARIEAARFSDGTLSKSIGRGPRFQYYNSDPEQRTRIVESLKRIFGGTNIINREYNDGRVARVRPTTEVIGHVLMRAGGMAGEVARKNPDIPNFILQGSNQMKREWLRQAFGDEGSPDSDHKSVSLSRAVDATHTLSGEQKNRLDEDSKKWMRKSFPDGVREQNKYRAFGDLDSDIQTAFRRERPRLLDSEARILRDDFSIETNSCPSQVCRRADGGYSVTWTMETASRESGRIFYEEIGFPQNRKQEKLRRALEIEERGKRE